MRLSSPRWHHRPRPPACCPCCPHVNAARPAAPGSCPPIAGTRPRWLSHCLRIGRAEYVRLRNKKVVLQGQLVNIPTASKCNSSSSNWKHSQKESQKVAVLNKSVSHGIPIHLNGIFQVWNSSNAYPKDKHFPCKRCWKPFSTKHFSQLEQKKMHFHCWEVFTRLNPWQRGHPLLAGYARQASYCANPSAPRWWHCQRHFRLRSRRPLTFTRKITTANG